MPEREAVEGRHGTHQADVQAAGAQRLGRDERTAVVLFQQALAQGEQVFDDGFAGADGGFAVAVGALIAPETLVALDGEFLDVAFVAAGFAGELAGGEIEFGKIVAAEAGVARRWLCAIRGR